MLTLILFRHAKSSWDDASLKDFERPLNVRGRQAAPRMGRYLATVGHTPDLILCSSAVRTRETAKLALAKLEGAPLPKFMDGLYLAEAERIMDVIRTTPGSIQKLMLIGHNPGLQDLAIDLIGRASVSDMRRLQTKLPTAAVVVIKFACLSWRDVASNTGDLESFVAPRDVEE